MAQIWLCDALSDCVLFSHGLCLPFSIGRSRERGVGVRKSFKCERIAGAPGGMETSMTMLRSKRGRMDLRCLALLGILVLIPSLSPAQQPIAVTEDIFNDHVLERTEPTYPPIAKAARIVGTVVIEVQVGTDGKIDFTKVVSGPAMLQQAALDCVKVIYPVSLECAK